MTDHLPKLTPKQQAQAHLAFCGGYEYWRLEQLPCPICAESRKILSRGNKEEDK